MGWVTLVLLALTLTLGPSFPEPSESQAAHHACMPGLTPTPAPTCQPRASVLSRGRPQVLGAGRELSAAPRPASHAPQSPPAAAQDPQSSFPHGSGHPESPSLSPR